MRHNEAAVSDRARGADRSDERSPIETTCLPPRLAVVGGSRARARDGCATHNAETVL